MWPCLPPCSSPDGTHLFNHLAEARHRLGTDSEEAGRLGWLHLSTPVVYIANNCRHGPGDARGSSERVEHLRALAVLGTAGRSGSPGGRLAMFYRGRRRSERPHTYPSVTGIISSPSSRRYFTTTTIIISTCVFIPLVLSCCHFPLLFGLFLFIPA